MALKLGLPKRRIKCMVTAMHHAMGTGIDELCRRQCAFACYCLPGAPEPVFCMAEDGRTESEPYLKNGFLLATFDGASMFIPDELTEVPAAETWPELEATPQEAATSRGQYAALFRLYTGLIQSGEVRKIVLARTADVETTADFSPYRAFQTACEQNPAAFKALVHTPQHGTWLFCTPEQLITGSGNEWHTMALAGTRIPNLLPWDAKNRREQALVTDFVRAVLTPLADELHESEPENLRAGRIEHLCTRFHLRMPQGRLIPLLEQLPPTPAVCGSPVGAARRILQQYPDIDRSCYAGYLGPWGYGGVQLYVSLRCMQIFSGFCRLYAGGGLMPDSDEEQEWLETENKMACMRQAIKGGLPL